MKVRRWLLVGGAAALLASVAAWAQGGVVRWQAPDLDAKFLREEALTYFGELPDLMPGAEGDTPDLIELGRRLYHETAVSINRTQSCNTCHRLDEGIAGVDNLPTSPGAEGLFGERNSPTVLNAGFQFVQFWDGREPDLAHQALGPPLNPIEMGMPSEEVAVDRLIEAGYEPAFRAVFGPGDAPVTYQRFGEAIAAFERTLVSRGRFDDWLAGNDDAITPTELWGLHEFIDTGCITCHAGPVLGGEMFQKMGLVEEWPHQADQGVFTVTALDDDKMMFKVPMMRNIILTAPYLHDGSIETVAEVVDIMARYQLGEKLSHGQREALIGFLTTLSDKSRTSPPAPVLDAPNWSVEGHAAQLAAVASLPAERAELVQYGYQLLTDTPNVVGPNAPAGSPRYSKADLACRNCHLGVGTQPYGVPWVGVTSRYPVYRARQGRMGDLGDRVNECFTRSMNGSPLPRDSREMQAILAVFEHLSRPELNLPEKMTGTGVGRIVEPNRAADPLAGEAIYKIHCQSCHAADGSGYDGQTALARPATNVETGGRMRLGSVMPELVLGRMGPATPPPWGLGSNNNGAGMARVLTLAPFIHHNMPFGATWARPTLSAAQAYDVAAYINSGKRWVFPNLSADYPNRAEKPIDTVYGPYADTFSREQHKYGPFAPIREFYGK